MKLHYAKFATCFALLFLLIFIAPQIFAQRDGHGPGPGPGHMYQHRDSAENFYGIDNLAYYGDWNSNRVFIIDGVFFEIDTRTLQVSRTLDLEQLTGDDVNILMGSFIWGGEGGGDM